MKKIFIKSLPAWLMLIMATASSAEMSTESGHERHWHGGDHAKTDGSGSRHGKGQAVPWTSYPTLKIMVGGEGQHGREVTLLPKNVVPVSVDAYSSDASTAYSHRQLPYDLIEAKLDNAAKGGFFWLSAREEQADKMIVASTVYYLSERGSVNPTAMFMQQKNALEIVPLQFPREHSRYRANEDWKFLVRFNGRPLAQQKANLVTQNGTSIALVSDANGVLAVHIPDDFTTSAEHKDVERHSHGRQSSDFVLAVEHADGRKTYLTGFNSNYGPDAYAQRSLAMGLGFTLLGMLGAAPLLRNRKRKKNPVASGQAVANPEPSKKEI